MGVWAERIGWVAAILFAVATLIAVVAMAASLVVFLLSLVL